MEEKFDYDTTSTHLVNIIRKVRTYIDVMSLLIQVGNKSDNDF